MTDLLEKASEYRDTYGIVGRGHYLAADHNKVLNRYFGIPVIIITAVVGTTIFGTLNENPDPSLRIIAGLVSLAALFYHHFRHRLASHKLQKNIKLQPKLIELSDANLNCSI